MGHDVSDTCVLLDGEHEAEWEESKVVVLGRVQGVEDWPEEGPTFEGKDIATWK